MSAKCSICEFPIFDEDGQCYGDQMPDGTWRCSEHFTENQSALDKFLSEHDRLCNWNCPPFIEPIICSCGLDEAAAELSQLRARLARAEALVAKWRYVAENKPIIEEQAIAMVRCANALAAALKDGQR